MEKNKRKGAKDGNVISQDIRSLNIKELIIKSMIYDLFHLQAQIYILLED